MLDSKNKNSSSYLVLESEIALSRHQCPFAVVGCIDFRFREADQRFVREHFGVSDFDHIKYPGGAQVFASQTPERETFALKLEKVCCELHDVEMVLLMTHWDCGAYGGSKAFSSKKEEESAYIADLIKAREFLKNRLFNVNVQAAYSIATPSGGIEYRLVE